MHGDVGVGVGVDGEREGNRARGASFHFAHSLLGAPLCMAQPY